MGRETHRFVRGGERVVGTQVDLDLKEMLTEIETLRPILRYGWERRMRQYMFGRRRIYQYVRLLSYYSIYTV